MGKYIVKKPIIEADTRYERGSEIELTEDRAAAIGADYVVLATASEETPTSPEGSEEESEGSDDGSDEESDEGSEESGDAGDGEATEDEGSNEE